MTCTPERCMGSLMNTAVKTGPPRRGEDLLVQAKDFIEQYFASNKRSVALQCGGPHSPPPLALPAVTGLTSDVV